MRADLEALCCECAVRYHRDVERCPACGDTLLLLSKPHARTEARQRLEMRVPKRRREEVKPDRERDFSFLGFVVPLGLAALGVLFFTTRDWPLGILFVLVAIGVGVWMARLISDRRRRMLGPIATRLTHRATRPAPTPPQLREPTASVRGRIRVRSTVRSPFGLVDCAAFRIVGATAAGELDDGGLGAFVVVTPDGEEVEVPAGAATIDLAVGGRERVRRHGPLRQFLRVRGLLDESPTEVAESVLVDGDPVVVDGAAVETAVADGYRGTHAGRAIVETPEVPRVVRRGG